MAFNVFDFVTDAISYPERHPVVYMDGLSGQRIIDLREELAEKGDTLPKTYVASVRKQIKDLQKKLDESALTFRVRGFSPEAREVLEEGVRKKAEAEGWEEEKITEQITYEVFAKAIVSVTGPDGEVDTQPWTPKDVDDFMRKAPNGSLEQFTADIIHVTVRAINFHKSVDVTF